MGALSTSGERKIDQYAAYTGNGTIKDGPYSGVHNRTVSVTLTFSGLLKARPQGPIFG